VCAQDDIASQQWEIDGPPRGSPDVVDAPPDALDEFLDGVLPGAGPPGAAPSRLMASAAALGRARFEMCNVILQEVADGRVEYEILPPHERRADDPVRPHALQSELFCRRVCLS